MEKLKEDYLTVLSQFYKKMIKHHKRKRVLSENFNEFINDIANAKEDRQYVKPANSTRLIEESRRSSRESPSKSHKAITTEKCYKPENVLYIGNTIIKTFVFAYLYQLIQYDNANEFEQISKRTKSILDNNKVIDEMAFKRINFIWARIGQLFTKRSTIRWITQLKQSYNQFSEDFLKILYLSIINKNIPLSQVVEPTSNIPFFTDLVKFLSICINTFDTKDGKIVNFQKIGDSKQQFIIGFDDDDKKYLLMDEVPGVKALVSEKVDNLNKKIQKAVESLLSGYKENTQKLLELEFLKDINQKQAKIKKYLSIDK